MPSAGGAHMQATPEEQEQFNLVYTGASLHTPRLLTGRLKAQARSKQPSLESTAVGAFEWAGQLAA